ncbi:tonB-system energizer ExbB [uncultured Bartonella sp.]|uniref:tonB-system energizer ExbB n=1 Tax=uncultured Bartonella sp. TaxID=104108 RepID=UPI0025CCF256|nr:tonB-system energizer ExbB [uncultured Bartonella sp.]
MTRYFTRLVVATAFLCLAGGYASAQTETPQPTGSQVLQAGEQAGEKALQTGENAVQAGENAVQAGENPVQAGENTLKAGKQALESAASETANTAKAAADTANQAADHFMASIPHDLSPIGMFLNADWVVKVVMVGLALASVLTWVIFIVKLTEVSIVKRRAKATLLEVYRAQNLSELALTVKKQKGVCPVLVQAAQDEVQASIAVVDSVGTEGLKERLSSVLSRLISASGRHVAFGTGILATIGAIGPFVGLFGTVWGIMNSFIGISQAQTTNLAVVAPGIAEALLATAIGLVAAVPAVIIYNVFARLITGYRQQLIDVSAGIERLVSRDLDFRKVKVEAAKRPNLSIAAE